ncbi:MAG TPA: 5'-3'-deoxyribonucleotidase [Candidatus Angelobacter sp.]|nr:5'-3'-deoxyribonucleotidase [Candidatus Angelobacter sp.]
MNNGNRQRIAIDMDEVLADTLAQFLAEYNREFGKSISKADLTERKLAEIIPADRRARLRHYALAPGFFRNIPLMADSQAVFAELRNRYEVFIATAAMDFPSSFNEKYAWIKAHFPDFPDSHIVFCGDKSVIAADFLIDDSPRHFDRFRGQGFLFTAPHNRAETRFPRLHNWADVRRQFL